MVRNKVHSSENFFLSEEVSGINYQKFNGAIENNSYTEKEEAAEEAKEDEEKNEEDEEEDRLNQVLDELEATNFDIDSDSDHGKNNSFINKRLRNDDEEDEEDDDDEYDEDDDENFGGDLGNEFSEDDDDADDDFLMEDSEEGDDYDDYDDGYDLKDALKKAGNFKVKNKKAKLANTGKTSSSYKLRMMRTENRELDPEVRMLLSQANEAFVRNDLQVALGLYTDVIKKDARNFHAYKAIGEIHKNLGNLNECCNFWVLAANLHSWDHEFWSQVAELSADLGHIDQAIFCYGRAITSDIKKSSRFIMQRAILYKEKHQFGKALDGLQKVRLVYPTNPEVYKHIASVYSEQRRLNDAINLYMKMLDWNINEDINSAEVYPKFDWSELNILLELHIQHRSFRNGLTVLKLTARWIQDRSQEVWDDQDDSEFDVKRRFKNSHKLLAVARQAFNTKRFELPIDIRFKLGVLRLGAGDNEEALHHFEYLLDEDPSSISDLYFEAGKHLEDVGLYEEALLYLTRVEDEPSPELVRLLGKCYIEGGDFLQAKYAYEDLLSLEPENADYKLSLAETLYHLGEETRAEHLINEVQRANSSTATATATTTTAATTTTTMPDAIDNELPENLSLIRNRIRKAAKRVRLTELEKQEIELNAKRKVLEKYTRMERLQDAVDEGDKIAISAWIQLASQLVEMFTKTKSFFPKDRMKKFRGIFRRNTSKKMNLDERLARAYNLLEGIDDDDNLGRHTLTSMTEFRGLNYQQWFEIFAQYALLLWRYEYDPGHADEILNVALSASIFAQDKNKEIILQVLKVLFGISENLPSTTVQTHTRNLLNLNQFSPFVYKFYLCCYASGLKFWENFACYNQQKYFLRQLKAYDSTFSGVPISGMALVNANVSNIALGKCLPDLVYIYANMLGGNRSYISSIFYMNRAYEFNNKDHMICLILALLHIHRSMQRLTSNRHNQLLQGISYFLEYKDLRLGGDEAGKAGKAGKAGEAGEAGEATIYEQQEVEYNFGRLFHMLGLSSLAVQHYNRVLALLDSNHLEEDYDLATEAAYNLTLIYNLNGNSLLARDLTEKYLVL